MEFIINVTNSSLLRINKPKINHRKKLLFHNNSDSYKSSTNIKQIEKHTETLSNSIFLETFIMDFQNSYY